MTTTGFHITGPCEAAYHRGCRCNDCRQAHTQGRRRRENKQPSPLSLEVERLNNELDAAELNLHALRQENALLRCRLEELEPRPYHNPELANGYPPRHIQGP